MWFSYGIILLDGCGGCDQNIASAYLCSVVPEKEQLQALNCWAHHFNHSMSYATP